MPHRSPFRALLLLLAAACALPAQPPGSWLTYNGDDSGRRFSPLTDLTTANVHRLSLAWATRYTSGAPGHGVRISATPLLSNGILYFTSVDNVWAADARTGREIWHYFRESKGNMPRTGNRGVGLSGKWLYFVSIDDNLVCLDAATGRERWLVNISDPRQYYFSTVAPVIVKNHVIVATGGDSLDVPAFIEAHDPETGALQWKWRVTPESGGNAWLPGTYDPDLNLYFVGTGNPTPVGAGQSRPGDNLWTCSIVALNPDTGKLVWHFQASPHDTHDWDAVETPVLIDAPGPGGQPRKLLAQASRNGYYFLLDRATGKSLVSTPFLRTLNWSRGVDSLGQPVPDPAKEPRPDGTLVSPATAGATNWPPPSFSPRTGLFYFGADETFSLFYLTDPDPRPQGFASREAALGGAASALLALDYKTGKVVWQHPWRTPTGPAGILTTAGDLLFTGNGNYLIAFDAATGKTLWHAGLTAPLSNGPTTWLLDGKQYVLAAAGDALYAFVLNTR